jgi:hypothetical protein
LFRDPREAEGGILEDFTADNVQVGQEESKVRVSEEQGADCLQAAVG